MTQEEIFEKLIYMYNKVDEIEHKIDELLKQKEIAEANFVKAKSILNDIMRHFEFRQILSDHEFKMIMQNYMEK